MTSSSRFVPLSFLHFFLADIISLKTIARAVLRLRHPFVFWVRLRTVAKDAFDRVGGSDVLPVLGREVVERQQNVAIFGQLFDRPLVFDAVGFNEQIEGDDGLLFCCRHPYVLQACLGLFMHWLGHSTRDVGYLVDPAALFFRRRVDVPQCGPKTQRTVPAGQIRRNRQPSFFSGSEEGLSSYPRSRGTRP